MTPDEKLKASSQVELCRDTAPEHVAAVLADPACKDWSPSRKLAEVMKRSKGSCNPWRVRELLAAGLLLLVGCTGPDGPDCSRAVCNIVLVADSQGHLSDPPQLACKVTVAGCYVDACEAPPAYARWCVGK